MEQVIGIDIGGTKTLIGFAGNKEEIFSHRFPTIIGDFGAFLVDLKENLEQFLDACGLILNEVKTIVISLPGLLDIENGMVIAAVNLNWRKVQIVKSIQDLIGVEDVIIEGDTRCGLIAEFDARQGQYQNMVYLTASTGIGCAMMIEGKIFRGAHKFAGEIGQMIVRDGKRLEQVASGRFLLESGNQREYVMSAAIELGNCIYNLYQVIDMETCVIGGGLGIENEEYYQFVQKYLFNCEQNSPSGRKYPIERSIYGTKAPLKGALLIARDRIRAK